MAFGSNAPYSSYSSSPSPYGDLDTPDFAKPKRRFSVPGWLALVGVVIGAGAFFGVTLPLQKAHKLLGSEYEKLAAQASAVNGDLETTKKKLDETEAERSKLAGLAADREKSGSDKKAQVDALEQKLSSALSPWASKKLLELEADGQSVTVHVPAQILFRPNTLSITPQGSKIVCLAGAAIKEAAAFSVAVIGHVSSEEVPAAFVQDHANAWALSAAEAASVAQLSAGSCGIEPSRLTASGRANLQPLTTEDTGRIDKNARVDLVFRLSDAD
jgi:flagellar motor protein MotB